MARINVSVTDEFKQSINSYARMQGITESAALVELAAIGLMYSTGATPVSMMRSHGGSKKQRQVIPLPQVRQEKSSVTLEKRSSLADAKIPAKSSVTLEATPKHSADYLMGIFQFAHQEDGYGILEWN